MTGDMYVDPRIAAAGDGGLKYWPRSVDQDHTYPGAGEIIWEDPIEETVALALDSARRWANRRDLSPELRLRRMWTVLTTALEEA